MLYVKTPSSFDIRNFPGEPRSGAGLTVHTKHRPTPFAIDPSLFRDQRTCEKKRLKIVARQRQVQLIDPRRQHRRGWAARSPGRDGGRSVLPDGSQDAREGRANVTVMPEQTRVRVARALAYHACTWHPWRFWFWFLVHPRHRLYPRHRIIADRGFADVMVVTVSTRRGACFLSDLTPSLP